MRIIAFAVVLAVLGCLTFVLFTPEPLATTGVSTPVPVTVRFRLDASRSTFIVHANRAGLAYFKGHSHRIAAKDFNGEASLDLSSINPASLTMTIRSASLEETDPVFTADQKKTINKELNEIVLETAKFPDITFRSTDIKGSLKNGAFVVEVGGDITLHGVTRHIVIPATVTIEGDTFHAKGHFDLNRKKFGVNATQAFHGLVKVRHTLKFE